MRIRATFALAPIMLATTLIAWAAATIPLFAQSSGFGSSLNQGDNLGLGFNNPLAGQENPLRDTAVVPCSLEFTAEQEIGERQTYMSLCEGFSTTISSKDTFETVIVGDEEVVSVAVINAQMLSITGVKTGATNVQFFTRRGALVKIVTINVVNRPDFSLNPVPSLSSGIGALSVPPGFDTPVSSGQFTTEASQPAPLLNSLTSFLGGIRDLQGELETKIEATPEEKQDVNVIIRAGGKEISYSCDERCARVRNKAGKNSE